MAEPRDNLEQIQQRLKQEVTAKAADLSPTDAKILVSYTVTYRDGRCFARLAAVPYLRSGDLVAASPDEDVAAQHGRVLASCGNDKTVKLWDSE